MTTSEDTTLIIKRSIQAPREAVFKALSTAEGFKQWFGPASCTVLEATVDLQLGAGYHLKIDSSDHGPIELRGNYLVIDPPSTLSYTFQWLRPDGPDKETTVTYTLAETESGTEVTLTHVGLADMEIRGHHEQGWQGSFDKLQGMFG